MKTRYLECPTTLSIFGKGRWLPFSLNFSCIIQECNLLVALHNARRRLATVLQEILQYQNTPYCIEPESSIQKFLISQDPLGDATPLQWEENLFQQSHMIEPKDQPPIRAVCLSLFIPILTFHHGYLC